MSRHQARALCEFATNHLVDFVWISGISVSLMIMATMLVSIVMSLLFVDEYTLAWFFELVLLFLLSLCAIFNVSSRRRSIFVLITLLAEFSFFLFCFSVIGLLESTVAAKKMAPFLDRGSVKDPAKFGEFFASLPLEVFQECHFRCVFSSGTFFFLTSIFLLFYVLRWVLVSR